MRRATTWAGWGALAVLVLLGLGSAASRPGGGLLVGLPRPGAAALGLAGVGLLAAVARRTGTAPSVGLLLPAILLLAGAPLPGVGALSGPPLLSLALAGAAVVLSQVQPRVSRHVFFPAVFLLYVLVAGQVQLRVGPRGDEPHYLMVTESLLRDRDLTLERDYAEKRYLPFHDDPLEPHYRVRGKGGEIYSLHAVGLSVLILPAYALGGYPAASLFMALLSALLALAVRELIRTRWESDGLAEGVGWTVALSPPLVHYAGLVFTEVPAALAVALALQRRRRGATGPALAVGLALACLPWLNVRYAALAGILLVYGLVSESAPGERAALAAPSIVSAAGIATYHFVLYGFFDPRRVYGRRPELALGTLPEGLPGLLLDQEFGLLVYAPVFALALPGAFRLWQKDRRQCVAALALVGAVLATAGTWHMWRGGWNPPARFLVPLVAVLALLAGGALRRGLTAGAALLVGWSVWIGLTGATDPRLVHRDRDGTAPIFRAASGADEWTRLLPGYVLADPDRRRLALVWAVALLASLPWRTRRPSAGRMAVAALGFLAAAGTASRISHAKSEGRDAVRVVDRAAIATPGWSVGLKWPARWGPEALEWGPLFEPHRHPEGVVVGGRLPLPPGRYRVRLDAERLGSPVGGLEIHPDRPGLPWRPAPRDGDGWSVDVREADGPVTLRIRGGGPFLLKAIDLRFQPLVAGSGPKD